MPSKPVPNLRLASRMRAGYALFLGHFTLYATHLPLQMHRYRLSYSWWCFWRARLSGLVGAVAARLCVKAGYRGLCFADSGYQSREHHAACARNRLTVVARPVATPEVELPTCDRILFRLRWRIETLIGQLKHTLGLEQLRHNARRVTTFKATVASALIFYTIHRALTA